MKKIIISIALMAFLISVALYSCKKTDSNNNLSKNDEAFVSEAKNWFNNTFSSTAVYKNATKDGVIKTPLWKYGKVYTMGNATVAEFPLSSNEKRGLVSSSENLTEAQRMRIAENTKVNILLIKSPNKPMEVRVVQYIPAFSYLENKNFDLSGIDLKNYRKDFKGSLMMFEYDNKFITGYSFSNEGNKTISFRDKNLINRKRHETNNQTASPTTTNTYLCNGEAFDPNCSYYIIWGFWFRCNGGWTVEEGYNPSYCIKESEWIESCELLSCSGTGNATEECLNNGNTQEQCDCMLYGIGCEGGGGGEEEEVSCATLTEAFQNGTFNENVTTIGQGSVISETADEIERHDFFNVGNHEIPIWVTFNFTAHNRIIIEKINNTKKFKGYNFGNTTKSGTSVWYTCSEPTTLGSSNKTISADKKTISGYHWFNYTISLLFQGCPVSESFDKAAGFTRKIEDY